MGEIADGRSIGVYRLLHVLRAGGTCAIWLAYDPVTETRVAIKLLHDHSQTQELRERLLREARLATRVEHPNVVRILDFGYTSWGPPYIAMELLEGCDLRAELCERGVLRPEAAVRLLLPLLDGLSRAHDLRVVHRDMKPENVFIQRAEGCCPRVPKLVDFGIARCLESKDARITERGSVFGTVRYLAPEQAAGLDDVDERADIWGFSAILYECITDQAPFGNTDDGEVLRAIIQDDAPPISEHGLADADLEMILATGLRRRREDRWPNAKSLSLALRSWLAVRSPEMAQEAPRNARSISGTRRISAAERKADTVGTKRQG
jgi:eukaryotic-like serine/threonine-protein kinase